MSYKIDVDKMRADNKGVIPHILNLAVNVHDETTEARDSNLSYNEKLIVTGTDGRIILSVLTRFIACDNVPSFSILKVTLDIPRSIMHPIQRKNFFGDPDNLHICFLEFIRSYFGHPDIIPTQKITANLNSVYGKFGTSEEKIMINKLFSKMLLKCYVIGKHEYTPNIYFHTSTEKMCVDLFLGNLINLQIESESVIDKRGSDIKSTAKIKITQMVSHLDSSWVMGVLLIVSNMQNMHEINGVLNASGKDGGLVNYEIKCKNLNELTGYIETLKEKLIDFLKDA